MVMDANYMCAQFSLAGEGICWTLGKSWVPPIQTGGTELVSILKLFIESCYASKSPYKFCKPLKPTVVAYELTPRLPETPGLPIYHSRDQIEQPY